MKTAIVYQTKLGATQKYASWLQEATKAELFRMDKLSGQKLQDFDRVVVMSGTYAGGMPLTGYLKQNWQYLENKKVVAVAVGAVGSEKLWSKLSYIRIPRKIRAKIQYFKIRGRAEQEPESLVKRENLKEIIGKLH